MYVYVCICICMCVYIYIYIVLYPNIYLSTSLLNASLLHKCVCVLCMYMYTYTHLYTYICIHTHTHTHMPIVVYPNIDLSASLLNASLLDKYIYIYIYICIHTHAHTHIFRYIPQYIPLSLYPNISYLVCHAVCLSQKNTFPGDKEKPKNICVCVGLRKWVWPARVVRVLALSVSSQ